MALVEILRRQGHGIRRHLEAVDQAGIGRDRLGRRRNGRGGSRLRGAGRALTAAGGRAPARRADCRQRRGADDADLGQASPRWWSAGECGGRAAPRCPRQAPAGSAARAGPTRSIAPRHAHPSHSTDADADFPRTASWSIARPGSRSFLAIPIGNIWQCVLEDTLGARVGKIADAAPMVAISAFTRVATRFGARDCPPRAPRRAFAHLRTAANSYVSAATSCTAARISSGRFRASSFCLSCEQTLTTVL